MALAELVTPVQWRPELHAFFMAGIATRLLGCVAPSEAASCDLGFRPPETRGKVLAYDLLRVQLSEARE